MTTTENKDLERHQLVQTLFPQEKVQESRVLKLAIDEIKYPLAEAYAIAVKNCCSNTKHLIRLVQYLLYTNAGEKLVFDFNKDKIEKACTQAESSAVGGKQSGEIIKKIETALDKLDGLAGFPASKHEIFVFTFIVDILNEFKNDINNISLFHKEKIEKFEAYNNFLNDPEIKEEPSKADLLARAGIPML